MGSTMTKKKTDASGNRGGGPTDQTTPWIERTTEQVNVSIRPTILKQFMAICVTDNAKKSPTFSKMVQFISAHLSEFVEFRAK